ncbi:SirA family protein [Sporosarcina sp. BP05]|uniref:SirA family protein n=1 Tax=Sporosarcina sp. BP05 TaxID=2758726 RepID=UPI0016445DDC|nr:SirA family protein [Sporosarcina sp. BP05]
MHANEEADITLEALDGLNKGELLQVSTDCPGSFRSVPEEAIDHGYTFAQDPVKKVRDIHFIFCIKKSRS